MPLHALERVVVARHTRHHHPNRHGLQLRLGLRSQILGSIPLTLGQASLRRSRLLALTLLLGIISTPLAKAARVKARAGT